MPQESYQVGDLVVLSTKDWRDLIQPEIDKS